MTLGASDRPAMRYLARIGFWIDFASLVQRHLDIVFLSGDEDGRGNGWFDRSEKGRWEC